MKRAVVLAGRVVIVVSLAIVPIGKTALMAGAVEQLPTSALTKSTHRSPNAKPFVMTYRPSEVDLRIRRVGLGSALSQVQQRFGVPSSRREESISDTTCGPPYTRLDLSYKGLALRLQGSFEGKRFTVVSVEVSSRKWIVHPGLRVGMEEQLVRRKLGEPIEESDEGGFHRLHYVNKGNDGFAVFYFKGRILIKMEWESNLC
jgi:hypothetical protein